MLSEADEIAHLINTASIPELKQHMHQVLRFSMIYEHPESSIFQLLDRGISVNEHFGYNYTLIGAAIASPRATSDFISKLLERGADPTDICNQGRQTALHCCVRMNSATNLALLLRACPIDRLNGRDMHDSTALDIACALDMFECVTLLAEAGAELPQYFYGPLRKNAQSTKYVTIVLPARQLACRAAMNMFVACSLRCLRGLDKNIIRAIVGHVWASRRLKIWDRENTKKIQL